jgi:hypothetical protein
MRIEMAGICKFDAKSLEKAAYFEIQNPVDNREKLEYNASMKIEINRKVRSNYC